MRFATLLSMFPRSLVLMVSLVAPGLAQAVAEPLDDGAMAEVTGQALFNTQRITSTVDTNVTFYRLMLDAQLDLNMNIESMKLGCGGVNNNLRTDVCDVDISNLRLMGRNGDNPGAVGSDMILRRPYLEFAIKNDGNKSTREVIGIKIGAQTADGMMGIGRYNPSAAGCDPNATYGDSAKACHTGLTSISGYMRADISATAEGSGYLNIWLRIPTDFIACFGQTSRTDDLCDGSDPVFIREFSGTRMTDIALPNVELETDAILDVTAYGDIFESLIFLHEIVLQNTNDFSISFQRERLRWPNFNPNTYAARANTGFWFNLPYIRMRDGYTFLGDIGEMNAGFGSGLDFRDLDLGQRPPDNCYGSTTFC